MPSRTLRVYTQGEDVRALQRALQSIGVLSIQTHRGTPSDDGVYGPQTADAVRAYQRRMGLDVDGVVGPRTWASVADLIMGAPEESPAPPAHPRLLPNVDGVWVHQLEAAVVGSPGSWASRVREAGNGLALLKLADGRETWHDGGRSPLLRESVTALRGEGVEVAAAGGWAWVYAWWARAGDHGWSIDYVREEAEALARACERTGLQIAVANCEGEGGWSMSAWGEYGKRARSRWPNGAWRHELDDRARAYAERLRELLGPNAVLCQSTHGLPSSQALPWGGLTDDDLWDVVMPQLYWRRGATWRGLVDRAVEEWAALGVTGNRLRISGGLWEPAHVAGVKELRAAVEQQAAMGGCAGHVDWWAWDKAKAAHIAALARA